MDNELKKELAAIKGSIDPNVLSPKIVNRFVKNRAPVTNYISGGNTIECDVMLEVEWNGSLYRIPAFVV